MPLTLERVEALAPDQSSLAAARKLFKPSLWPTLAQAGGLLWGECQGSGATPYRVVATEADGTARCTCPSRKYPCKHALALLWMSADAKIPTTTADPPEWVKDWLSRRRKPSLAEAERADNPQSPADRPSISAALAAETAAESDPQAAARSAAARERNRQDRESAILAGLDQLDTWLADQLEHGMLHFVAHSTQACRTIAQRLVDAKAPSLAGRLDSLPALLFTLPESQRAHAAVRELGQVRLIAQAYRRAAELDDSLAADARQSVGWTITREALLNDPDALHVRDRWCVFAVIAEVQPDRLRRIETWLWRGQLADPRHAVLIEFAPVSSAQTAGAYRPGDCIEAELVYYRSSLPSRAQIVTLGDGALPAADHLLLPPRTLAEAYAAYQQALATLPWLGTHPLAFRDAVIRRRDDDLYLCDPASGLALPLPATQQTAALPLTRVGPICGIGLWNGYQFTLAWADTSLGRWLRA